MRRTKSLLLCLCFLAVLGHGICGTVLVVLVPGPTSHLFNMRKLGSEIASRNHKIAYLAMEGDAEKLQPTMIPIIRYTISSSTSGGPTSLANLTVVGAQSMRSMMTLLHHLGTSCDALMQNASVIAQIKDLAPEVLVGTSMYPCLQVLSSKLELPFVNFLPAGPIDPMFDNIWRGANYRAPLPNPLSYLPQMGMPAASQHLSFPQRLRNAFHYVAVKVMGHTTMGPLSMATLRRHGVDPDARVERERCALTICAADFAVEWLRPLPPSLKFVGPLLPEPARPLPTDLEDFMNSAGGQGVLLVATGTVATLGPKERLAMAATFAKLPLKVLWKLSKGEVPDEAALAELNLGSNTKVVSWLPQNDVLGHRQTRAFLSHCGANSMYEAAYHGVPIIGLPFFADQPGNADKAVAKGFAVRISHGDLTGDGLLKAALEVLSNPKYATAAAGVSVKLRARKRTPVQEAIDWVEHVLATRGEAYLRTPDEDLSWLARMGLDVLAAYLGALCLLAYLSWRLTSAVIRAAWRKLAKLKRS
ncbi:UDP-glucuronosyltransferase 2A1 [Coccomyxa sp. Obi]|nr:UDP-glucuronosyltransferase 2A1 [Coccomyxa sp. Obi]